jgi:phage/plasmid-associated DNA primase
MNWRICAFPDGQLNVETLTFTPIDELEEPVPSTFWFFEASYLENNGLPTPLWDSLTGTQLKPSRVEPPQSVQVDIRDAMATHSADDDGDRMEAVAGFEALVGRLLHPVGAGDNWSVQPFLKGDGNTGKSSVLDLIRKMFPGGSVAVLSSNFEGKFGLENWVDKRCVIAPDIPARLDRVLDQTDWQAMVSGDPVSVPRKNRKAIQVPAWKPTAIWAGNHLPSYRDNSGSASRRLAVFKFETLVEKRDTTLVRRIESEELVAVLLRCLATYHETRIARGNADFWSFAPRALLNARDEANEETNHLAAFIANGDDYYQCTYVDGAATSLLELKRAFQNHMKFVHPDAEYRWTSDYHPLRKRGYQVKKTYVCKICQNVASARGCGDHYESGKNRKQVTMIHNLELQKKKDEELRFLDIQ